MFANGKSETEKNFARNFNVYQLIRGAFTCKNCRMNEMDMEGKSSISVNIDIYTVR